ncbi:LysR family transcriptional regulator [Aldersonia sp. NBC_00410]|uniref:LysR family transcriptional regulator n=1 Tax=Aldersonia sp. NBC_00410 TaxID=2975954 RepID=UPI00224E76CA|nr:LysR family transcriptional regulator [Aldersonia sp. NBC_00410]MCX5043203.1 LysR family transcriptional regulator [Aldersonia sp. NBC_00410]
MDTRRLEMLLELSELGSMREVADELGVTTSTVSQQLAMLARDVHVPLLEPDGRRVRLTPAGRRLATHAVTILAAVEAARMDLDPDSEPVGEVRVASFASAARRHLLPLVTQLADTAPKLHLVMREHEPAEALDLLARDRVDLALVYDYNLAPHRLPDSVHAAAIDTTRWGLGVPAGTDTTGSAAAVFRRFRDGEWIVNSRNTADDEVVRTIAALADFTPRITHRADSLELVQDLIAAGLGVGLLPAAMPAVPGVDITALHDPAVTLRSYVVTRRGRESWAPVALLLRLLTPAIRR